MTGAVTHSERVVSIHYLRGIAALMIVALHIWGWEVIPLEEAARPDWLKRGVAIFFVISGFVMVTSTQGREQRPGQFFRRRFIRVVPFWWVMLTLWVVVGAPFDWLQLLGSYLFIPTPHPELGELQFPVLGPGWTLNYEMAFYLLFALSLLLPRKIGVLGVMAVLCILPVVREIADLGPWFQWFTKPMITQFAAGMAIAWWGIRLPVVCIPLGFVMLALLSDWETSHVLGVTFPAAMIVAGARSLDGRLPEWKFPTLLGDASYSIYLTHIFVIHLAKSYVAPLGMPLLSAVVVFAGAIGFGVLIHRRVEQPLIAYCNSRSRKPAPPLVSEPA